VSHVYLLGLVGAVTREKVVLPFFRKENTLFMILLKIKWLFFNALRRQIGNR
tara:strand:- start:950 stop:1105 length:156 start_codon:yes stop_codon:yes gene_type:complete